MGGRQMKTRIALLGCLLLALLTATAFPQDMDATAPKTPTATVDELAAQVLALGLGEDAYVIGAVLTADQQELARDYPLDGAYPGTVKFADGPLHVVADAESHLILALYRSQDGVLAEEIKQMVGHLMANYGPPTTMAHSKIMYWAYGPDGKIDEDTYQLSKETGSIDILATVKFNSNIPVSPGMTDDSMEDVGNIYYIITSDPLLGAYVKSDR